MNTQDKHHMLHGFLKKKGIGPTMGKHLDAAELQQLSGFMGDPELNLTTKATLLTALLTLEPTSDEAQWIAHVKQHPDTTLPKACIDLIPNTPIQPDQSPAEQTLKRYTQQVIAHHDLNKDAFREAMTLSLDPDTPHYITASFLEAERLKRETLEENMACFDVMWEHSEHYSAKLPRLIDLSNAYDGFNRTPLLSPYVAALLASCGYPTVLHGIKDVAPKKGLTPYKLLEADQKQPLQSPEHVIKQLEDPEIGWGYIDQRYITPSVFALEPCRTDMVKRPILATMEKLMQPIQAETNYLVTGYTHPPYKAKMTHVCGEQDKWTAVMIIRGVEGSAQPPLDRRCPCITIRHQEAGDDFIRPRDYGLEEREPTLPENITATYCVEQGTAALQGQGGDTLDWILYQAQSILTGFQFDSPEAIKTLLLDAIHSGKAFQHYQRAL